VRHCVVRRLVQRFLITRLVAVFVCSYWKTNFSQSITYSINYLGVNVADPEVWVLWWFRFHHSICKYLVVVCY